MKRSVVLVLSLLLVACSPAPEPAPQPAPEPAEATAPPSREVLPGVEVLLRDHADELSGLRVAILTNPTGVTRRLESTVDAIGALPGVELVRLFGPEQP